MPAVREHRVDRERILLVLQQERAHERQHLRKHEARDLLSRRHQQHFRSCEPETQDAAFRCAQARLAADCVSCDIGRGSHMSRDTNTTCCRYASGASGVESGAGAPLTAATAQGSASTRRTSAPPPAARHVGCHGRHLLRVRSHGSEVRSRAEGGGGPGADRTHTVDCHARTLSVIRGAAGRKVSAGGGPDGRASRCWPVDCDSQSTHDLSVSKGQDLTGHRQCAAGHPKYPTANLLVCDRSLGSGLPLSESASFPVNRFRRAEPGEL